jgi:ectoine hydroxylase-related dioxygenase (phytanoyl-CoA dioxygenase family)
MNKLSAFVPLTSMHAGNGGMTLYCGTHLYGHLGDAGVIKREHTKRHNQYTPTLFPGDMLLMHSSTWHESAANNSTTSRVLADIHYQPATDPTTIETLRITEHGIWRGPGSARCQWPATLLNDTFERSRTSRLQELQKSADDIDKMLKARSL